MSLSNVLLIPGLGGGYNLVDAANAITPIQELWVQRSATDTVLVMMPYDATHAYYYDIAPVGDECMVIRNCFRRPYTKPGGVMTPGTTESLVKQATNLEFAIRCRLNGTSDNYRFFPQHESVNTVFLTGSRTFVRDGVTLSGNDGAYVQCSSFSCDSSYNCIHPDVVDPLAILRLRHWITTRGISCQVEFEFLQDTQTNDGYSIMNNVTPTPKLGSVYRSDTGRIAPVTLGGDIAAPGQDFVTACAMGQDGDSSVLIADWSSNLQSVRVSGAFNSTALRQWFINTSRKFYNQPFKDAVIPAGSKFTWGAIWRLAEWSSVLTGIGSQIIVNGTFASGDNWTLNNGGVISSGKLEATSIAAGLPIARNTGEVVAGKNYRLTFTISDRTGGGFSFGVNNGVWGPAFSTNATHTQDIIAPSSGQVQIFTRSATTTGKVDDVSVREILPGFDI